MRVKSGPPPTAGTAAAGAGAAGTGVTAPGRCSSAGVATATRPDSGARSISAARPRPVATSPAANPAATSTIDNASLRMVLFDADATRAAISRFRNHHRENAVFEIRSDVLDVDPLRQRERAREASMAALD